MADQINSPELHVVTGAFGYSGRYIAEKLIEDGHRVRTLTNSPDRQNPFEGKIEVHSFNFDKPDKLVESLRGANVLYNTYWVRFNFKSDFTHSSAVDNTLCLFGAAKEAGVGRIVHTSITNPSLDSHLEYFSGKAELEEALQQSGIPHSILRPAVLFGPEDILINNIAWMLRRFPVFGVFGDGRYRLQPIHVDDFAKLAIEQGKTSGNTIIDAIGPETFTFRELVEKLGSIIGKRRPVLPIPPTAGYMVSTAMGKFVSDVVLTRDEIEGLMADLLYTNSPPVGETKLTEWAKANADSIGTKYSSELARRRDRVSSYEKL